MKDDLKKKLDFTNDGTVRPPQNGEKKIKLDMPGIGTGACIGGLLGGNFGMNLRIILKKIEKQQRKKDPSKNNP